MGGLDEASSENPVYAEHDGVPAKSVVIDWDNLPFIPVVDANLHNRGLIANKTHGYTCICDLVWMKSS